MVTSRQDPLCQRRARARKANDEVGPFGFHPEAARPFEERGREGSDQPIDEGGVLCRIIILAARVRLRQGEGIGPVQVLGGLLVALLGIEHLGQAEVQGGALAIAQVGIGQEPAQRGPLGVG
jgi:hypothetical protein